MFMSFDLRTYSDCKTCIVLSVLLHIKDIKAVYSVNTEIKANFSSKHYRDYLHRCKHTCKRRLMHDIDVVALNVNHTAVYTHIVIACDGPTICMCAMSDNTAMTTELMVI